MRRIACVVTARPSWSRVRTALRACRDRGLEVHVIAAASAVVWKYGVTIPVLLLVLAFAAFLFEAIRSRSITATGLACWVLAELLLRFVRG